MEKSLTKIRDIDLKILSELDDRGLLSFCKVSKYANTLCYNEDFWRSRIIQNYPKAFEFKSKDKTWRNYYLSIVMYLNKFYSIHQAMYEATRNNKKDLINFFISRGADDFLQGMRIAALKGNKDLVVLFISKAAEKGHKWGEYEWDQGLIQAILGGYEDLAIFFISKGAHQFNQALIIATHKGNKKLIDLFISHGANDWKSALLIAKHIGNIELIQFFENKIREDFLNEMDI